MWKLLNFQGVYGGGGYAFTHPDAPSAHTLPLDPVSVARQANLTKIGLWAVELEFTAAIQAHRIVTGDRGLADLLRDPIGPEDRQSVRHTASRWKSHIESLIEWNVLERTSPEHVKFCARTSRF